MKYGWLTLAWLALGCSGSPGADAGMDSGFDAGSDAGVDAGMDAGTDGGCDLNAPTTGDLPADVKSVLQAKCVPCHQNPPLHLAKFPLETYEDTQHAFIPGPRRWNRMSQVIEAPNLPHMPPEDAGQLDAGDFATLRAWFAACAPGLPEDGGDPGEDGGP